MTRNRRGGTLSGVRAMAVRVSNRKKLLDVSDTGAPLVALFENNNSVLENLINEVIADGQPAEARLDGVDDHQNLWLVGIPERGSLLIVARDTTIPDKVTAALIHSRMMMKDLLGAAADLAFELDTKGRFAFVSPAEFLGQSTGDWVGLPASDIFWSGQSMPRRCPFGARGDEKFNRLAYYDPSGDRHYLNASVKFGSLGPDHLPCLRGTITVVTDQVKAEQASRQERLRLSLQERITRILITAETSDELLGRAAKEVMDLLRGDVAFILRPYEGGFVPAAVVGGEDVTVDLQYVSDQLTRDENTESLQLVKDGEREHLLVRLQDGTNLDGLVLVSRDTGMNPWKNQEKTLLTEVVDIIEAAKKKAALFDKLTRLSGQDELTRLLNRRALKAEIDKRLLHQRRTGQSGCLLFIDLDNFKEVNDTLGHQAGDEALKLVADTIRSVIRPIDIAGRYGGDEFVLWVENIKADSASSKAQEMIDAMPAIRAALGRESLSLSMSIGLCESNPDVDADFQTLSDLADQALYQVKQSGKGKIAVTRSG